MVDENTIIYEANEYLNNNKTIKQTASDLGISKRTLQLHIKRLKQINEKLYEKVIQKQEQNMAEGRVRGGQNGKASPSYTKEFAISVVNKMYNSQLTYKQAAEEFDLPKSTIYEMVHSDFIDPVLAEKLDILAAANQHDMTIEDYLKSQSRR